MTKEVFTKIISSIQDIIKMTNQLSKIGVIISNSPIYDNTLFLCEYIFEKEYGKEGLEWINWFLYDLPEVKTHSKNKHHAFDENGNSITLDTMDDLYDFLEKTYQNV
jgi:hypothetical protein